jgi:hypothetical protein
MRLGRAVAIGVVGGLLALTRPEGLLIAAVVLVGWALARIPPGLSRRRWAGSIAVAALSVLALFGPWLARNHSSLGTWSPTTEVGLIAVGANSPESYSGRLIGSYAPLAVLREAEDPAIAGAEEATRDRALQARARTFASHHLVRLPVIGLVRVLRTFEIWDPQAERAAHAERGMRVSGWWYQWASSFMLVTLAVFGVLGLRRRRVDVRPMLPVLLCPVAVASVALVAYGEPFMRAAIDPALALMAATLVAARRGDGGTGLLRRLWHRVPGVRRPRETVA